MTDKKNIIIMVIDALRPKNLSLFGYERKTDPNLCKIAEKSIVFKKNFSSCNATAPSLNSIFTGFRPPKHKIMHQLPYTKQEEINGFERKNMFWLPEFLKNNGYETIAIDWIGLWFKKGFNYYGEGDYDSSKAIFNSAENITDLAISKMDKSNKPFFLFLHFWDTHFPFPHTPWEDKKTPEENQKDMEKTIESISNAKQKEYLRKRIEGKGPYTFEEMKEKYDLSIEYVDKQIGKVYDFLTKSDLLKDTIVVILGDHGTSLTEHETYYSSSGLYDDCINTLLMMKLPGMESKEISEFVQDIDIVPTLLEFTGLKTQENFDGKSLLNLINHNEKIRDYVFTFDGLCEDVRCIRTNNQKLIISKNNFCNLCKGSHHEDIEEYDLEKDPSESKNIYLGFSELKKILEDVENFEEDSPNKVDISSKDWF
jgi:arylsulfatase A-like enzyme